MLLSEQRSLVHPTRVGVPRGIHVGAWPRRLRGGGDTDAGSRDGDTAGGTCPRLVCTSQHVGSTAARGQFEYYGHVLKREP